MTNEILRLIPGAEENITLEETESFHIRLVGQLAASRGAAALSTTAALVGSEAPERVVDRLYGNTRDRLSDSIYPFLKPLSNKGYFAQRLGYEPGHLNVGGGSVPAGFGLCPVNQISELLTECVGDGCSRHESSPSVGALCGAVCDNSNPTDREPVSGGAVSSPSAAPSDPN